MRSSTPKGPGGTWKTGQRAPRSDWYRNQFGQVIHLDQGGTFPPRVGRNSGGDIAYWEPCKPMAVGL